MLESLPSSIANLKNLKSLLLHKNRLRTLPTEIITLKCLTEVLYNIRLYNYEIYINLKAKIIYYNKFLLLSCTAVAEGQSTRREIRFGHDAQPTESFRISRSSCQNQ